MTRRTGRQEWHVRNVGGESGAGSYDRHVPGQHKTVETKRVAIRRIYCSLAANSGTFHCDVTF